MGDHTWSSGKTSGKNTERRRNLCVCDVFDIKWTKQYNLNRVDFFEALRELEQRKSRQEQSTPSYGMAVSRASSTFGTNAPMAVTRMASAPAGGAGGLLQRSGTGGLGEKSAPGPAAPGAAPPVPTHEQHFGGIASADPTKPCIFFLGIIDILTNYGFRKRMEHSGKTCLYPTRWKGISCCPPGMYAKRFLDFMRDEVFVSREKEGSLISLEDVEEADEMELHV